MDECLMPIRVGFVLVRLFPLYVLVLAMDALRLANKHARRRVFDWSLISDLADAVQASNGIHMDCDVAAVQVRDFAYVFLIAGDDQARGLTPGLRQCLIRIGRSKCVLGAIDSGVFLLAACRLIGRRRVAVHPAAVAALVEQYPMIRWSTDPVVIEGSLWSCAGGVSVVNLMMAMIELHAGPAVARAVAEDMVLARSAASTRAISPPATRVQGVTQVQALIRVMEQTLEIPLSLDDLAQRAQCSRRQLTRQFQDQLGCAPMHYYRMLRLNRAKQLLSQSGLSVSEVAMAVGFQSLSTFSRRFATQFGYPPRELRTRLRTEGNAASVPARHQHTRLRRQPDDESLS
jgi:AraC family carnitine catabolism transcriptional activator